MKRIAPWVLIALFLALAVGGALFGSISPVWQKAIRVCRECIGIG